MKFVLTTFQMISALSVLGRVRFRRRVRRYPRLECRCFRYRVEVYLSSSGKNGRIVRERTRAEVFPLVAFGSAARRPLALLLLFSSLGWARHSVDRGSFRQKVLSQSEMDVAACRRETGGLPRRVRLRRFRYWPGIETGFRPGSGPETSLILIAGWTC